MGTTLHLDRIPPSVRLKRTSDGSIEFCCIDQRCLPQKLTYIQTRDWQVVVDAIKTLAVRGAPAIGVAGAAAMVLWAGGDGISIADGLSYRRAFCRIASEVSAARPTAVNLEWGVSKMLAAADTALTQGLDTSVLVGVLFELEQEMEAADEAANRSIGAHGVSLLPDSAHILTHCNAGSLATVFYGTALGIVYAAAACGRVARVYADETRPVCQGARLTVWELARAGIPVTLICDNMAASLMEQGIIDAVIVGADRIAANGDVANKIGTYGLAVLAHEHNIPFYVAAPTSSVDASTLCGAAIPIEQRASCEVLAHPIAGVDVFNPAFDVTPARFITNIITEHGVFAPQDVAASL